MKAMILAAGKGERLRPLTLSTPKPLVPLCGKPLIVWRIEHLARIGIQTIVINCAWLGEQLPTALGDGKRWGVRILYAEETTVQGTGGGVLNALPLLGDDPFILVSGDIVTNYSFERLCKISLKIKLLGHLILIKNPLHHLNGDYCLKKGCVIQKEGTQCQSLTFASIALVHPQLFSRHDKVPFSLVDPFDNAIAQKRLTGEHFSGYHCNVDTLQRLRQAENDYQSGKIRTSEP